MTSTAPGTMAVRRRRRPLPSETAGPMLAEIQTRCRAQPLGTRQRRILDIVQRRARLGRAFPSLDSLAAELGAAIFDVNTSLIGLAQRGFVVATSRRPTHKGMRSDGWRLTDAGRTA